MRIKRCFSIAMLIVGTVIGAGFATGAEIASFFGSSEISPLIAALCAVLLFLGCILFLSLGSRYKPRDIGDINALAARRARPVADGFMLLNALIVTAGMLAAFESIGRDFYGIPAFSLVFGVLSAIVVMRGIGGVIRVNAVAIPAVIVIIIVVSSLSFNSAATECTLYNMRPITSIVYVSMNMLLASGTLIKVQDLKKSEIVISSAIASVIIGALMCLIILSMNSTRFSSSMPMLETARSISKFLMIPTSLCIVVSVFTTLLSSMNLLADYAVGIIKKRPLAVFSVLIVGLVLSTFGFDKVVGLLYPVMGAMGVTYMLLALILALRSHKPNFLAFKRARKKAVE